MVCEQKSTRNIILQAGWILVLCGCLAFWACSSKPAADPAELIIASWNVEALFDGHDDGFEYGEYTEAAGWTEEKYRARLNTIAGAAGKDGLGADILALIEIENAGILRDLAELPGMDYRWSFFAGTPGSAIGLGILSRFPLAETRAHSIYQSSISVPRPIAEVRVDTRTGPLVFLICHWKSKRGGEEKTEEMRRAEAGIAARRLEEIAAAEPETPVIVLGDLNENGDEFERSGASYLCALLPDTAEAATLAAAAAGTSFRPGTKPGSRDFLILSGERPPRTEFFGTLKALYSPWQDQDNGEGCKTGSYYYKDAWEAIDHFLLNAALFDGRGWEYSGFRAAAGPPFTGTAGIPAAYNPRTGSGLSDHLPIVLTLRTAE